MKQHYFKTIGYELPYSNLKSITTDLGRVYETPKGKLISVTTCLSILSEEAIKQWRQNVGEAEANRVSRLASDRGSAVHQLLEDFVHGKEIHQEKSMPPVSSLFNKVSDVLVEHVDNVRGQEIPLYSEFLGLAGRVDLIAEWDGELAIIDYKTSSKPKIAEWCHSYFMQETAYAIMWEELTGEPIRKLVTIIGVDGGDTQIFIEDRNTWAKPLMETIERYVNEKL